MIRSRLVVMLAVLLAVLLAVVVGIVLRYAKRHVYPDYFRIVHHPQHSPSHRRHDPIALVRKIIPNKFLYHNLNRPIHVYTSDTSDTSDTSHTFDSYGSGSAANAVKILVTSAKPTPEQVRKFQLVFTTDPTPTSYSNVWHFPAWSIASTWYSKPSGFFDWLYKHFPEWRCPDYVPQRANWTLLDPSKPIKVINLDRSVERWLAIQEQFRKFPQIAYERFAAVEGSDMSHNLPAYPIHDAKSRVNIDRQARLRSGEIGVYLSNLELWYALVRDVHNDYYMILEDDVILNEGFQAPDAYVRAAPVDWDVIFVGYNIHYCKLPHTTLRFVRLDYRCMPGHFGYIIRKRAAQYYLNFALPIEVGIDEFQRMQAKNLNLYVLTSPGVSTDYYNASTIERSPGL